MDKIIPAKLEGDPGRSFDYQIVFADGRRILVGDAIYHSPEFAEFICLAVNTHQALVDALGHFREWHANHFEGFDNEASKQLLCLDNEADAALALARGESADPKAVKP